MHSCPRTVLGPMITSPSWQRILVPSPTQTNLPNRIVPFRPIWISSRLPKKTSPSVSHRQPSGVRNRRQA